MTTKNYADMYNDMDHSKTYIRYRHRYSKEVFQAIADYCKTTTPDLKLAIDVGCGPGMSTIGLTKYFKKVIGVDISPTQIECAPKDIPGLEFKVGCSDQLPFVDAGTADLYCAGQAFQYMPRDETFTEADRVLRPGGTIAIFGYEHAQASHPVINDVLQGIYKELTPHWPKGTTVDYEDKFGNVELPYNDRHRSTGLKTWKMVDLDEFMGFMRSLYPFRVICKNNPERNFGAEIERRMSEAINTANKGPTDNHDTFELQWDIFLLMAHKPY